MKNLITAVWKIIQVSMTTISITGYTEKQFSDAIPQLRKVLENSDFHPVDLRWKNGTIVAQSEHIHDENFEQFMELLENAFIVPSKNSIQVPAQISTGQVDLCWNENSKCWQGAIPTKAKLIQLYIDAETSLDAVTAKKSLANYVEREIRNLDTKWKCMVVQELYDTYVNDWVKSNPLNRDHCKEQLVLSELRIDTDGCYWVYYDSGTLFEGNVVVLIVTSDMVLELVRIG